MLFVWEYPPVGVSRAPSHPRQHCQELEIGGQRQDEERPAPFSRVGSTSLVPMWTPLVGDTVCHGSRQLTTQIFLATYWTSQATKMKVEKV